MPPLLLVLAFACSTPSAPVDTTPPHLARARAIADQLAAAGTKVVPDDPQTCAPCHAAIVSEWGESMHSRAHHDKDPIYAGMRSLRIGKEGDALAEKCSSCHHPRERADAESAVAEAGVSCATCHNLAEVDVQGGKKGHAALTTGAEGVMRGPHDLAADGSPVHGTGPKLAALADGSTLCLACHAEETNKAGVPTCTTGVELRDGGDPRSCVSCHMPSVAAPNGVASPRDTHLSHAFLGPHRAWLQQDPTLLAGAVGLDARLEGDRVIVRLENKSAHGFPSGFPARMAVVVMRGLGADGQEVWRNVKADPMVDHPDAVLNKVYVDDEGKPTLAPYATKLARDNRLRAGETREVSAVVPAGVAKVDVALKYWLVAPVAAKAMGVAELPETKPVDAVTTSVTRSGG